MLLDTTTESKNAPVIPRLNGDEKHEPGAMDELNEQARRIQELMEQVDALPDLAARALLHECLETVLSLQGRGLAQILQIVQDAGPEGQKVLDGLIANDAVRAILLIHGLHPVDLATRLQQALDKVRPYMESHGGNVELLSLENDVARLRLHGTCKSCPSSAVTMELAVRRAIEEFCPDLAGFEVEGAGGEPISNDATVGDGKMQH
ncbi:MAG TPA: NifU family protein [Verrucomicrobiae bacterium]|jgi:Fe-S cluster biogenesis protein NfuA|nr:NifU family protein [Verrucomicrobiae bacterium]